MGKPRKLIPGRDYPAREQQSRRSLNAPLTRGPRPGQQFGMRGGMRGGPMGFGGPNPVTVPGVFNNDDEAFENITFGGGPGLPAGLDVPIRFNTRGGTGQGFGGRGGGGMGGAVPIRGGFGGMGGMGQGSGGAVPVQGGFGMGGRGGMGRGGFRGGSGGGYDSVRRATIAGLGLGGFRGGFGGRGGLAGGGRGGGVGMGGGFGAFPAGFGGFEAPAAGGGTFGGVGGRGGFGGGGRGGAFGANNFATQAPTQWDGTIGDDNGDPLGWMNDNFTQGNQNAGSQNAGSQHGGDGGAGPGDPLAGWGNDNVMGDGGSRAGSQRARSRSESQSASRASQSGTSRQSSAGSRASTNANQGQWQSAASNNRTASRSATANTTRGSSRAPNAASGSDSRIPPPGTVVTGPIILRDSSGNALHALFLTLKNPAPKMGDMAEAARKKGKEKRSKIRDTTAAEIALNAMIQKKTLREVSDGPRGAIYVIEKDQHEVYGALAELRTWRGGRWELLGVGTDKNAGRLFMLKVPI
ncbi:hypothetical protein BU16DRAFT_147429 [Lophium mytilinum]|uniref:Uncharacterized protein n=1 Tax=Lophium mytilinum TaxID=390894 RepID=A0A6A6QE06_9PEZI|nr:hypothetical protein BU16DRAFT_147429 [Lophium mytilinum]